MSIKNPLQLSLLMLRLAVFLVMFVWTLDKFIQPDHTVRVFAAFYKIPSLSHSASRIIGLIQLAIIVGFLAGFKKKLTYGAVFLMHAVSTLASYKQYFSPYEPGHLLFFAAWPMLAACFALYVLRDQDKYFAVSKK